MQGKKYWNFDIFFNSNKYFISRNFWEKTEFFKLAIMGLYNEQIVAKLIQDITFFSIYIQLQSFLIVVSNISYLKNNGCHARNDFISSLQIKFQGKYSLV